MKKRWISALLISTMLVSSFLTGCGSSTGNKGTTSDVNVSTDTKKEDTASQGTQDNNDKKDEIVKPEKITVMVNGTFHTAQNGQAEWVAKYKELTGVDIEIIQPDHSSYYEVLSQTFASGDYPDVVLLSSTYYTSYAAEGILWDMTEAWENNQYRNRLSEADINVVDALYVGDSIYGFTRGRGNGTVTYIKKAWLDNVGLGVPTTYEEFLAVCDAFRNGDPDGNGINGDTYALSAAGLIGPENPYVNYLPEFYQDAYPSFYKDENGTWVDGFTQPAMKAALERLRDGYEKGYIDPETLTNDTKAVRNKFYENKTGIFAYWAGKWADNLKVNLEANDIDSELVAIPPIAEVGQYIDRATGGWAITAGAENPEGIYKYFIEPMIDGGEVQALWTFGVDGVHYSDKAETVLDVTYEEGQIHGLESRENPGTVYAFDVLALNIGIDVDFVSKYNLVSPATAVSSQELFNANSKPEDLILSTDAMAQYNGDLMTMKKEIIANVVTQGKSIEEEFARFEAEGGVQWSKEIVDSLNAK